MAKHIALEYRTSGRRAEGGRAPCTKASSADALGTHHALEQVEAAAYENFACGAERNYTGYCNRELEREFDQQSTEADAEKRKHPVWEIDRKLQEDGARPMIYHNRAATCWYPQVKGVTIMVNSSTTARAMKTSGSTSSMAH